MKDKTLRIIVTSTVNRISYKLVNDILAECLKNSECNIVEIVSSTIKSPYKIGEQYARENNLKIIRVPFNGDKNKLADWFSNNEQMIVRALEADEGILVAFCHKNFEKTENMIEMAYKYGLEVIVVDI